MKKKISKKNAVIIAGAVVAVTAVGGTAYAMSGPKLALNKEKVTVEYGTQYKPELKDIVKDYKDFDKKSLQLINKIPNEKDKTYPAVGKYTITVKYKKNSLKQSVIVKETATRLLEETRHLDHQKETALQEAVKRTQMVP